MGNIRFARPFLCDPSAVIEINKTSEGVKTFFLLYTDVFGGKQVICGRDDLFLALRCYPWINQAR